MKFEGVAYRGHDPRWSFLPISGEGAARHSGRFNPKGLPTLYLALDPMTALREVSQGLKRKLEPCTLCSYDVDCEDIVDLRSDAGRAAAGIDFSTLSADWFGYLRDGRTPPQWTMAERLRSGGAAGILVPSFAGDAPETEHNLVLWSWGPDLPHRVVVFDPSERLPKDASSWN